MRQLSRSNDFRIWDKRMQFEYFKLVHIELVCKLLSTLDWRKDWIERELQLLEQQICQFQLLKLQMELDFCS